jgi:hypothetical protein
MPFAAAKGGYFKEYILNDVISNKQTSIMNCPILELGITGNYFTI